MAGTPRYYYRNYSSSDNTAQNYGVSPGDPFASISVIGWEAPSGMQFKEWNSIRDGSGVGYQPGAYGDHDILFAIWEEQTIVVEYLTDSTELTSIANAIRAKGGTSQALEYPDEFVSAIQAIPTGGTIQGLKSVTPSETAQSVTPDSGYDGIAQVNVGAISSTYVGSGIARKSSSDLTASGATVTAPAGYYSSAASKAIDNGSYSASVSAHSISTIPVVTGSLSGTITDIGTTTKPSGTDGTNYWTITPSGSVTTTGVSTAKGTATISAAGYIAVGSNESSADTVNITPSVVDGSPRYIQKASATVSGTNLVTPSVSVVGTNDVVLMNTTANGIAVIATGGGTANVLASATTNQAGYAPESATLGTAQLSAPENTTTSTKYIYQINVPITRSFTVTNVAGTATNSSQLTVENNAYRNVSLSNSGTNAKAVIQNSAEITSLTNSGTIVTITNNTSKQIGNIANSGNVKVTSGSTNNGDLVVSAYKGSETILTQKQIVSSGRWVAPNVTAGGTTYYGAVTVPAGTITNNTSGGQSSGTIARGQQIKIGAGFHSSDKYYTAQANSGTLTLSSGGSTSCDGYQTVVVASGSAAVPDTTISATPSISVSNAGLITATVSEQESVSPTVTAGYVSSGTAGDITVSGSNTSQLATQAAQTITPTTTDQTIASGKYLTGAQTIKGDANLVAGNIKKDVTIFGVTGTHEGGGGGGGDKEDGIITRTISVAYENTRVTTVGSYAFYYCTNLTAASFPSCTSIGNFAFYSCNKLATISFPSCTSIGGSAFNYCYSLSAVNFPVCTSIGNNAFGACLSLTTISFPVCTTIGNSAFATCNQLTAAIFPSCTSIGSYAFTGCSRLTTVSFPSCTGIGNYAFSSCLSLTTISLPSCTSVGSSAFYNCSRLTSIELLCSIINQNTFTYCKSISIISLPNCTSIGNTAFASCYHLLSLYLLGSSIVSLAASNAFNTTPISNYTTSTGGVYGSIYVPSSLLASYKTKTNWTYFSRRFVGV